MAKTTPLSAGAAKRPWTSPLEYAMDCKRDRITRTLGAGTDTHKYAPIPGYNATCPLCGGIGEGESPSEAWSAVCHDDCPHPELGVEFGVVVPTTSIVGEGDEGRKVYHQSPLESRIRFGHSWAKYGTPLTVGEGGVSPCYQVNPGLMTDTELEVYRATRQREYLRVSRRVHATPRMERPAPPEVDVAELESKGIGITPSLGVAHDNADIEGFVESLKQVVVDTVCPSCGVTRKKGKGKVTYHRQDCEFISNPLWRVVAEYKAPPKPVAPAAPKQGEANPLARFRKS